MLSLRGFLLPEQPPIHRRVWWSDIRSSWICTISLTSPPCSRHSLLQCLEVFCQEESFALRLVLISLTLDNVSLTRKNNFWIRLLVGCHGLENDAARFQSRSTGVRPHNPSCKLCGVACEDAEHYIALCPALSGVCSSLFALALPNVTPILPDPSSNPVELIGIMLGTCWIDCKELQTFRVNFLDQLRSARIHILSSPISDNSP